MVYRTLSTAVIFAFTVVLAAQPPVTKDELKSGSKVFGIDFENQEIDSLYQNTLDRWQEFQNNRQLSIDNSVAPALYFNPTPSGYVAKTGDDNVRIPAVKATLPNDLNDLAFYSIGELSHLIRSRQITCVRLTEFFLDRLLEHDETLHCVITYTRDRALAQARMLDDELASGRSRGPLHGIPYGLKDLFAVKGYTTTWGATPYKDQVLQTDAAVVEKLDESGAILIAKLSLGALAWGDVWYNGKTRNPWSPDQGSSGSSAGSASAVAAGLVPFAIGTETLGSIVSPSTVCGTTGLRPTFGRVSRYGAMALSWSMDKVGPICRNAQDCAIVFTALKGRDPRDLSTTEMRFEYQETTDFSNLKVGYLPSMMDGDYPFQENDAKVLETLREMGVALEPIELPEYPDITFLLSVEAAAAFDELTRSGADDEMVRQIRNAWPNVLRAARFVPAVEYIQAQRLRTILIDEMANLFAEYDVIIHPSWHSSMLSITNMTGHPTVVVPNGFRNGTPTSISFTGQLYEEGIVLNLARAYQQATGWHLQHPPDYK